MTNRKLCYIADLIPIRVFPLNRKKMGPIGPIVMTDTEIFGILNMANPPIHFYALDPNDHSKKVTLTKNNYNKTTEELFATDDKPEVVAEVIEETPVVETEPVAVPEPEAIPEVETVVETETATDDSEVDAIDGLVEIAEEGTDSITSYNGKPFHKGKRNRNNRR